MFYDRYLHWCNKIGKAPTTVAMEIGLKKSSVTKWKNGGGVTDANARKVADYFGVSVDDLISEEKEKTAAESDDRQSHAMTFLDRLDMLKLCNQIKTNRALSEATGIPCATIEGWYKSGGATGVDLSTLETLASFFDVSIAFLVRDMPPEAEKALSRSEDQERANDDDYIAVRDMLLRCGWITSGVDLTDQQTEVLTGVIQILQATFKRDK